MDLLTPALRIDLRIAAERGGRATRNPVPLVKFFDPLGIATWLAAELDRDSDTLFGLADLGCGCPELGSFSLSELASIRLPFGLGIARDLHFRTSDRLSVWAETARTIGTIRGAETFLARMAAARDPLPPPDPGGG